jgi:hypothetical protein
VQAERQRGVQVAAEEGMYVPVRVFLERGLRLKADLEMERESEF